MLSCHSENAVVEKCPWSDLANLRASIQEMENQETGMIRKLMGLF